MSKNVNLYVPQDCQAYFLFFLSDFSDISKVSYYLSQLEKKNMYSLGLAMGLDYVKLKDMMDSVTFKHDVIAAWLRREDNVQTRGAPSW